MNFYHSFRPLIFKLDAETAHNLVLKFLRFCPRFATIFCFNRNYKNLRIKLWDIDFTNPIGMAAGFDKNAEVAETLAKFGFGFVEVGTVTPNPQTGNDKPRIFRLIKDLAIINRLGFNNLGAENFARNLQKISTKNFVLGINIGKNRDSPDAVSDYLQLLEKFYKNASYITINISSPNTKNLRDLQKDEQLEELLGKIMEKKNQLRTLHHINTPILLKVAPDLSEEEQQKIAASAIANKIDGIIISNTTVARDLNLRSKNAAETGGLSGKPLFDKSNQVLKNFYRFTSGKVPLVGVGGISSAADAYEKIRCGASLVQIYSAFVYQGFGLVERIKKELSEMVERDGFKNVSQAVGVDSQK